MITPKSVPDLLRVPLPAAPNGQQPIRILICGVLPGVNHIVHQLHVRRFAEAGEWSPPLPSPVEGEVIRILLRYWHEDDSRSDPYGNSALRS
ncbi:MAG: hypothetical protein Fur0046_06740 [Cyanobacteria bacterium J069]